jgi:hypothetical protein
MKISKEDILPHLLGVAIFYAIVALYFSPVVFKIR